MAKFKFAAALTKTYAENSQVNPIRWEIMYLEDDGVTMTPQTGKFKCKDFFNEFVCKIQTGVGLCVYYMDTRELKFNPEGVWCRVTSIDNPKRFITNVDKVVNAYLPEDEQVKITDLGRSSCLIYFPKGCFENTYKISLITWLIRVSNFQFEFTDMDSVFANKELAALDKPFNDNAHAKVLKWKFQVPAIAKPHWFYQGEAYNSTKLKDQLVPHAHTIHNCGVGVYCGYIAE